MATDRERIATLLRSGLSEAAITAILNADRAQVSAVARGMAADPLPGGGGTAKVYRLSNPPVQAPDLGAPVAGSAGFFDLPTKDLIQFELASPALVLLSWQASHSNPPQSHIFRLMLDGVTLAELGTNAANPSKYTLGDLGTLVGGSGWAAGMGAPWAVHLAAGVHQFRHCIGGTSPATASVSLRELAVAAHPVSV